MIYRIYKTMTDITSVNAAYTVNVTPQVSFLFDSANTDYQTFKAQILSDKVQLEDADGNLMTAEEAKAFISELP